MTKDRIKDLQKPLRSHEVVNDGNDAGNQFTTIDIDNEFNVANFLNQIDLLRSLIDKIEELTKDVKRIHSDTLQPMADPKLEQKLDDKRAEVKKLAYDISTKLKKMEQSQENQDDTDKTNAQWRIKETQIFVLIKRFQDTMGQYNQECDLHIERCKNLIKRELDLSGNKKSDDELNELVENGFPATYKISVMIEAQNAIVDLNYIEARQRDIEKLETSIRELHSMFVDLALLVAIQGGMIDNIEHNVSKAVDFVGYAAEEVEKAGQTHDAAVKKKIIIYIILIAIVVILILIFIAYLIQKRIIGR